MEHPFTHPVFIVVAPSTAQRMQGRDDRCRFGAAVRSSPRSEVPQESVSLLLLWEGRAVSFALADREAKAMDSLGHLGEVGFRLVQCSPSFRPPCLSKRDHRFAVLLGASRHEDVIGVPDPAVPIRPFLAHFLATIWLGGGVGLLLAVCRQQCL